MQRTRRSFGLVSVQGILIAVGGDAHYQPNYRSLEWLNPNTGAWEIMSGRLEFPAFHSAFVALR